MLSNAARLNALATILFLSAAPLIPAQSGPGITSVAVTCPDGKYWPAGTHVPDVGNTQQYLCPANSGGAQGGGLNPLQQQMINSAGQLSYALGYKLGTALFGPSPDEVQANALNNQAIDAANHQQWRQAETLTGEALKLDPDNKTMQANLLVCEAQAVNQDALAAEAGGSWAQAVALFQQGSQITQQQIKADPENKFFQENLAWFDRKIADDQNHLLEQQRQQAEQQHQQQEQQIANDLKGKLKIESHRDAADDFKPPALQPPNNAAPPNQGGYGIPGLPGVGTFGPGQKAANPLGLKLLEPGGGAAATNQCIAERHACDANTACCGALQCQGGSCCVATGGACNANSLCCTRQRCGANGMCP